MQRGQRREQQGGEEGEGAFHCCPYLGSARFIFQTSNFVQRAVPPSLKRSRPSASTGCEGLGVFGSRHRGAGLAVDEGFDDLLVDEGPYPHGLAFGEIRGAGPFVQHLPVHTVIAGGGVEPNSHKAGAVVRDAEL